MPVLIISIFQDLSLHVLLQFATFIKV